MCAAVLSIWSSRTGHLDMVKFLLDAGADQEHKTDEMHTALMEASMVCKSNVCITWCIDNWPREHATNSNLLWLYLSAI